MTDLRGQRVVARIDRTWEGRTLPDRDTAVVQMDFGRDTVQIDVRSPFHGDPPPPAPPGPTDALWNFEIVEVFLAGRAGYLEVELGPWGHYLVLELGAPRVVENRLVPIDFRVTHRGNGRWEGTALVPVALLPQDLDRFNAYRIHGSGATREYLARFPVPGQKPDFHRLECFGPLRGAAR